MTRMPASCPAVTSPTPPSSWLACAMTSSLPTASRKPNSPSRKVCTQATENVIEANTYLSGVGFESGGLAAAHAIHNGLTVLPECHHMYHGEKVAFGTLTQLVLENRPMEDIEEVLDFCYAVGLPVTLEQLGVEDITEEKIMAVAEASCAEGETIFNMPFEVNADSVYAAIMAADAIGQSYLMEE